MDKRLIKTLLIIAMILMIIIIAEFVYARYADAKLNKELNSIVAGKIEAETLPSVNLKKKPIKIYTALINRPLFSHNRRPIEEIAEVVIPKVAVKTSDFKHELIGIFGKNNKMSALFRNKMPSNIKNKNNHKKSFAVQLGETGVEEMKGWMITKINSNSVIIENNGSIETIKWSKTKPKIFRTLKGLVKKKAIPEKKTLDKNKALDDKEKALIPPPLLQQ